MRQLKWFPCSGILYLCFKSLGLDITSVLLNPFKMVATYPFCDFFLSKNHTDGWFVRDTLRIEKVLAVPTNFLNWKIARIGSFRFLYRRYRRYTYEVVPIYELALTLDRCPWEINQYFLLELHHELFTLQPPPPKKKRGSSRIEQMTSSQEHLHSYIKWWM